MSLQISDTQGGPPPSDATGLECVQQLQHFVYLAVLYRTSNHYTPAVRSAPENHINQWAKQVKLQIHGNQALSTLENLLFVCFRGTFSCAAKVWVPLNVEVLAAPLVVLDLKRELNCLCYYYYCSFCCLFVLKYCFVVALQGYDWKVAISCCWATNFGNKFRSLFNKAGSRIISE